MRKILIFALILTVLVYSAGLVRDLWTLQSGVIRLHVVGASDSEADQAVKLQVRDAVNSYLSQRLDGVSDREQALVVLEGELAVLEAISNSVLEEAGFLDRAQVSLEKEAFPLRNYDTFSLPSGVYETLRIRIGAAQGRNWWCVVFPSFCLGAAAENPDAVAAGAGFSQELSGAITGEIEYELRFYFLDCLGQVQNFFHGE